MRKPFFQILASLLMVIMPGSAIAQANLFKRYEDPPFVATEIGWVDSVFNAMSLEERIGQLFMVAAYSDRDATHEAALVDLIENQHIGGLIFFQGGPSRQAAMTERLQAVSKVPLMLGMDAEWGLAMRLDSTIHFPYQMTLGAIRNDTMVYEMGKEIGRELKRLGVHVNFAPVVDVNNNPANPVINYRSFGENPVNVARKGTAYMKGLQAVGVMANAKHFPGHGDTDTDSHKDLPIITHGRERLDSIELYPFRQLTNRGLASMMVAHLYIPELDSTEHLASTLSPRIVTDLLKEELGFRGLVFTDALNMKGVAKYWKPGEVDLKALLAGNDVLLFPEDVPVATEIIKQAIEEGTLDEQTVNLKCHRILKAKSWAGLSKRKPIIEHRLYENLNSAGAQRLNEILYERALTLLKNEGAILPLREAQSDSTAYLAIGAFLDDPFHLGLKTRGIKKAVSCVSAPNSTKSNQVIKALKNYRTVVIGLDGMNRDPKQNFGLSPEAVSLIEELSAAHEVILTVFGNPYALAAIQNISSIEGLIIAYEGVETTRKKMAQALFGELDLDGRVPVSIGGHFKEGEGLVYRSGRLRNSIPEEIGLSSSDFLAIDSIALNGVEKGAYPGCVVLVAKEGKVLYERSFGYHTYQQKRATQNDDIFDLASITKMAATGAAIMKLVEEGAIDINGTLGDHLSIISDTSAYKDLLLRDVLTHQAGLIPWIPFYNSTMKDGKANPKIYRTKKSKTFNVEVARDLYMDSTQKDSLLIRILSTPLRTKRDYKYSDLGYYLMKAIIEEKTGMSLDAYVAHQFYRPMGLSSMDYLPLKHHDKDQIVPTEYDMYYRMQLLRGYVHDMGAAMQGGVGGHAGLFSDASDLAALMQMFLNKGVYGHQRLLDADIITEFTKCQFCTGNKDENRRGVVFDKPNRHGDAGPTCDCVSYESFGHSGFTGTLSWADPAEDLVYIFLSNRIYPSMDNRKLIKMSIRTEIMEVIYRALDHREDYSGAEARDLGLMEP
jgi:beta-glucosidase-like glycosyl hydrolase/CubicO group peptidase (beta-lactamase class C family)